MNNENMFPEIELNLGGTRQEIAEAGARIAEQTRQHGPVMCGCTISKFEEEKEMKEFEGNFYIKKVGTGYHVIVEGGRFAEEMIEKEEVVESSCNVSDVIGNLINSIHRSMLEKDNKKKKIKELENKIAELKE